MDAGELTRASFDDYKATCALLIKAFGSDRLVSDLRPDDFLGLRKRMSKKWGPVTLAGEIGRVRVVFGFAWQAELIDKPLRFGPTFKRPSRKVLRQHRQAKGKKFLDAPTIRAIFDKASPQLRAMALLGVNAGLGNRDCAKLELRHLDLAGGWLDFPRPKTGIERRAKLWPESVAAIKAVLAERKAPKDPRHAGLVFVTKYRQPWCSENNHACPISHEFKKLMREVGAGDVPGSFYLLRHVFETVSGESRDQVAVDHVMGHTPPGNDMASVYRESISDARLIAVADHVHAWLFPKPARTRRGRRNG
jgi:integrase